MDLIEAEREVAAMVGAATSVDPTGAGTHREVGGPAPEGATSVRAPAGIVAYEPADLTVCVGAGTRIDDLAATLGAEGQECALDPRDPTATVGGAIAVGLSGPRRLRVGALRDQVLEVRFATADGRLVRGGGPTVKNVTGYDLPRLLVGSFGSLGVLTRVILRCRPRPARSQWGSSAAPPSEVARRCFRPSSVVWDGATTYVLLEGNADDVDAGTGAGGLVASDAPPLPDGAHRGRAAVPAAAVEPFGRAVAALGDVRWLAEIGV
ncbi:MAG: FAD-binding protein, partial [Acidimicrobiia bacterium]